MMLFPILTTKNRYRLTCVSGIKRIKLLIIGKYMNNLAIFLKCMCVLVIPRRDRNPDNSVVAGGKSFDPQEG